VRACRRCKGIELTAAAQKDRGILPVLTAGFGDRGNGGVRPVVKRRRQRWWCSVSGDWGHGEEQRKGAASAVRRGRGGGAFYRAGEAWGGGEVAGGGGVLLLVGFEGVKGGGGDGTAPIQWGK
jgi:hypothetical protein